VSEKEKSWDVTRHEDGPAITAENAIVVIATELREIRHALMHMAFDPNCETVLGNIHTALNDNLQTFPVGKGECVSLAEHVRDLVDATGNR
jgi:hypothetical protein